MAIRDAAKRLDAHAREQLGFAALYEEQRRAISAAVEGRDVLVVMPTGSGKSAIYQLTGELRSGPTVVVSPLLALQYDQLGNIAASGLSRAAALNSLISTTAWRETLDELARDEIEFLFVAPEQLAKQDVVDRLRAAKPSLFVVDEAHCISAWGHDFRPDYLRLGDVARALGRPPVLALTATAAPPVRDEIVDRLRMTNELVLIGSFDRPEIDLRVDRFVDEGAKRDALVSDVAHRSGSGIVYVATRKNAVAVTDALRAHGVDAATYHGSLGRRERHGVHERFLDNETRVVVATNAFGMGIDKPDVRFVFHHDVPGSLDAYYQEIGRAGRDGDESEAVLYYVADDLALQKFFAGGTLDAGTFAAVVMAAHRLDLPASLRALSEEAGLSRNRTATAVDALARAGALRRDGRGRVAQLLTEEAGNAVGAALESEEVRAKIDRSRIEMTRAFAETSWCRRAFLVGYYGQAVATPCGRCDNCRAGLVHAPDPDPPFTTGELVVHPEFGPGTVMLVEETRVVVLFDEAGYRVLSTALVLERELLQPAS